LLSLLIAFSMMALPALGYTHPAVSHSESFEDPDTVHTNPSDSWYSYSENGWDYANVSSDANAPLDVEGQCFLINDTDGDGDYNIFDFADMNYSYFEFWLKVDNSSHNETNVTLYDSSLDLIVAFNITTDWVYCYNDAGNIWSEAILNNTWYKIRTTFNWTDNTVYSEIGDANIAGVYDGADASAHTDFDSTDIDDLNLVNMSGTAGESAYLFIDDMKVSRSSWNENTRLRDEFTGTNLLLVIFLGIAVLLIFVFLAMEIIDGKPDMKRLLTMLVAVIIMVIAMGFI